MTTETTARHSFEKGTLLNAAEMERFHARNHDSANWSDVVTRVRTWNDEHKPFDRGLRLPLLQYVVQEGTGGALVPINQELVKDLPQANLMEHAHDQLLSRLDFQKKTFDKLPAKLQILNLNYLIQNHYDKEVLLRCIDGDQVRGLLSTDYSPFDDLELVEALAGFPDIDQANVRWDYSDDKVLHCQITFPSTATEIRVGDVVETGLHITNSAVGVRSVTIAALTRVLLCSNMAIGDGGGGGFFRFRHVGDPDRLRDHVKNAIESAKISTIKMVEQFRASVNKAIEEPATYLENLAKDKTNDMTQAQFKAALNAFLEAPEPNLWGVTNAITKAAHTNFGGEARYEMERLGAKVLEKGLRS